MEFLQQLIKDLSLNEIDLLQQSLFLGLEDKNIKITSKRKLLYDGTFVVIDLLGFDPTNGPLAIKDTLNVGQKVQVQARDIEISQQEIEMGIKNLLKKTGKQPILIFLFSFIGKSKCGSGNNYRDLQTINNLLGSMPLCGAFFQGEIGQINSNSHLHSYSSCLGLIVKRST